ncbi:MAG: hypothetical protein ACYC1L_12865 [Alphaproteobacteria bacterium]
MTTSRDGGQRPTREELLSEEEEIRFTLRAPRYVFSRVDALRRQRPGHVSRNTWILEAITEKLQRETLK